MIENQFNRNKKMIKDIINDKTPLTIDIINDNYEKVGYLRPITKSILLNDFIIKKLTKWRNNAMQFFMTQFNATFERTKNWLNKTVLSDNTRLLFIIYDSAGKAIGNLGFTKLNEYSAELDNLIRGETGGGSKLIYYSEVAIIKWIFSCLKIEEITGNIFSDNLIPMSIHKKVGFLIREKYPLYKKVINNEIKWIKGKTGESSSENKYLYEIVITPDCFLKNIKNKVLKNKRTNI